MKTSFGDVVDEVIGVNNDPTRTWDEDGNIIVSLDDVSQETADGLPDGGDEVSNVDESDT